MCIRDSIAGGAAQLVGHTARPAPAVALDRLGPGGRAPQVEPGQAHRFAPQVVGRHLLSGDRGGGVVQLGRDGLPDRVGQGEVAGAVAGGRGRDLAPVVVRVGLGRADLPAAAYVVRRRHRRQAALLVVTERPDGVPGAVAVGVLALVPDRPAHAVEAFAQRVARRVRGRHDERRAAARLVRDGVRRLIAGGIGVVGAGQHAAETVVGHGRGVAVRVGGGPQASGEA